MVKNVVFPCGAVEMDGKVYLYYGGSRHGGRVATVETDRLLNTLLPTM